MTKHNPLPWKFCKGFVGNLIVYDNQGNHIATISGCPALTEPEIQANADFILRACNAYEDLLGSLQTILEEADDAQGEWAGVTKTFSPQSTWALKTIAEMAEDALAKAKGAPNEYSE